MINDKLVDPNLTGLDIRQIALMGAKGKDYAEIAELKRSKSTGFFGKATSFLTRSKSEKISQR